MNLGYDVSRIKNNGKKYKTKDIGQKKMVENGEKKKQYKFRSTFEELCSGLLIALGANFGAYLCEFCFCGVLIARLSLEVVKY